MIGSELNVWIGLKKHNIWVDDTPFKYDVHYAGQPNGDPNFSCGIMAGWGGMLWADTGCLDNDINFVCEINTNRGKDYTAFKVNFNHI